MRADHFQDNSFVMFLSDHGYHLGQFTLRPGKSQPYETDLRVPLAVRGPGVRRNVTRSELVVSTIDLAPTLVEMAGTSMPGSVDGTSFLDLLTEDVCMYIISHNERKLLHLYSM